MLHTLEVRLVEFTPGFYLIRVNDLMLIGTYLAETGYKNLTLDTEMRLPINVPNPAHAQFIARSSSDPLQETHALTANHSSASVPHLSLSA